MSAATKAIFEASKVPVTGLRADEQRELSTAFSRLYQGARRIERKENPTLALLFEWRDFARTPKHPLEKICENIPAMNEGFYGEPGTGMSSNSLAFSDAFTLPQEHICPVCGGFPSKTGSLNKPLFERRVEFLFRITKAKYLLEIREQNEGKNR